MALTPSGAHAFAPGVPAAIALHASSELPNAAAWPSNLRDDSHATVSRMLERDAQDPEAAAILGRFDADSEPSDLDGDAVQQARAMVNGAAPWALDREAHALRDAFAQRRLSEAAESIARIAIIAADLADPFFVTVMHDPGPSGARAHFSDLLDTGHAHALIIGLDAADVTVHPRDARVAAVALARESAAVRGAVEAAYRDGDTDAADALRDARLAAATRFASGVVRGAWLASGGNRLDAVFGVAGALRVWPNPATDRATVSFTLPVSGRLTVELFDAGGRRVFAHDAGLRQPGRQTWTLRGNAVHALTPGAYFVRMTAGTFSASSRFIVRPG